MKEYKVIKNMTDGDLINAYKEIRVNKSHGKGIIKFLQNEIYKEENKTIPLTSVKYYVAMEMVERFCNIPSS